jgi:quercetin dioxygenase-like cupin family protein
MSKDQHKNEPWEPQPIAAEDFHQPGKNANINRAPHDQVSGLTYKRAMNIKRVQYEPLDPSPDMPELWQGHGSAVVRWLFSEQTGTVEHLLAGATFAFLHDIRFPPGASSGQQSHPGTDHILYVIDGQGMLYHRPSNGSPVLARPLRPGDAVLVRGSEYYSIANESEAELRLIVLGLS